MAHARRFVAGRTAQDGLWVTQNSLLERVENVAIAAVHTDNLKEVIVNGNLN